MNWVWKCVFFNGRLGFDYTYYQSKTKDQICAPRLAQSTGYIFLTLNGGSVENKGMELSITGKPIVTKDFQWETTLIFPVTVDDWEILSTVWIFSM